MKKIVTLLLLLCMVCTGAWADDWAVNLPNATVSVSSTKANYVESATSADDNDHWYVMQQSRDVLTPVFDPGVLDGQIKRKQYGISTYITNGETLASSAKTYLVRIFPSNTGDSYYIQFATGRYFGHTAETLTLGGSGTELNARAYANADKYLVYNIASSQTHIGVSYTQNGTTHTAKLDNNGKNAGISYWGSGQQTTTNGNNDWSFYAVEFTNISTIYNITVNTKWGDKLISSTTKQLASGLSLSAVITPESYFGATCTPSVNLSSTIPTQDMTVDLVYTASDISNYFKYESSYADLDRNQSWHTLRLRPESTSANAYFYYEEGQSSMPNNKNSVDESKLDQYLWGFVGNPVEGFKIYNRAAGDGKILSSSTTMSGTAGGGTYPLITSDPVSNGKNTYWTITQSTVQNYTTKGFFISQKGFPGNTLNKRESIAYWTDGKDIGSTVYADVREIQNGYTVHISGLDDVTGKTITYGGNTYGNDDLIEAATISENELSNPTQVEGYTVSVSIEGHNINVVYKEYYYVSFDKDFYYTSANNASDPHAGISRDQCWQRAINKITINTVEKDVREFGIDYSDTNRPASDVQFKAYRDLTESTKFYVGREASVSMTVALGTSASWVHGYAYIDANNDKQFTISEPNEMVAERHDSGQATHFEGNAFTPAFTAPSTAGEYRMRLVIGSANNPEGGTGFTAVKTGQNGNADDNYYRMVDFTLVVGATQYTVNITGGNDDTQVAYNGEQIGNNGTFYAINFDESNLSVPAIYGKDYSVEVNGNTINITYSEENVVECIIYNPSTTRYVKSNLKGSTSLADGAVFSKVATSKQVEYNSSNADVFLLRISNDGYVGQVSGQSLTTQGAGKFNLTQDKASALEFIYVGNDIIPVQSIGNNDGDGHGQLSWNWFGGFSNGNDPALGLYGINDGNSQWEFKDIRELIISEITNLSAYTNYIGEGLNKYSVSDETWNTTAKWQSALDAAQTVYDNQTKEEYISTLVTLGTMKEAVHINMPTPGSFIRLKGDGGHYITSNTAAYSGHGTVLQSTSDTNPTDACIFYYNNGKLLSFTTGCYIKKNNEDFATLAAAGVDGGNVTFSASRDKGKYNFVLENRSIWVYNNGRTDVDAANATNDDNLGYRFNLEEVTELPIGMNQNTAGENPDRAFYGSIYLPTTMTVPTGTQAYIATYQPTENLLHMELVGTEGEVIPEGAYILRKEGSAAIAMTIGAESTVTMPEQSNVLTGTILAGQAFDTTLRYALSGKNGIGFYKYNPVTYPIRKAVYIPAEPTAVAAFYFDFGDPIVTAIQELQKENQENGTIFDLQGRRIQKVQKGMNIINGRKVLR